MIENFKQILPIAVILTLFIWQYYKFKNKRLKQGYSLVSIYSVHGVILLVLLAALSAYLAFIFQGVTDQSMLLMLLTYLIIFLLAAKKWVKPVEK
jgi:hypothetical protein